MPNLDYSHNPVDWLLLHSIPGMGPATFRKLLQIFGEPQKVFSATRQELINIGINKNLITQIFSPPPITSINKILLELKARGFKIITLYDSNYPNQLKKIKNPPPILYVYGNSTTTKAEGLNRSIAIIGATEASKEGLKKAFKFAYELAGSGVTIVSGYARGIDTQAHLGAIKAGGKTIMVLPTGVLNFRVRKELYPVTDELFSRGTILSESFPTAQWTTAQALLRNRITAGLSDAVLVVEPGAKGGTVSTARWAKHKPIFISSPIITQRGKEILQLGAIEIKEPQEIIKFMKF